MLTSAAECEIAPVFENANVAVDQGSGKAAARCGAREDDELVSASGKRTHDCASQIAGAPGHEYFHEVELNS